jgi:ABC-type transporter Mla maintaining outer membrane lipid asymmetry ATPase subunit MlaF
VAGPNRFVPPEKRGVGLMFQDFALFPHPSIFDNVAFGLKSLTRREAEAEARRVGCSPPGRASLRACKLRASSAMSYRRGSGIRGGKRGAGPSTISWSAACDGGAFTAIVP